MAKSLLCKSDIDFLLVLAENERYLSYKEMVNLHFAKEKKVRQIENESAEKEKIYANFRQSKRRLKKNQELTGRNYFLEDENSKMFKIHKEAVEKPKTCVILLEFTLALKDGTREVKGGNFEQTLSAKYVGSVKTDEWSERYIRGKLKTACRSGYISFDKTKNEYSAELRLTSDLGLIVGIVKSYRNDKKTDNEIADKLEELLKNF